MRIEINVTSYVFKYLVSCYGDDPYHLAYNHQNDLRLALEYLSIRAEPVPRQGKHPGRKVILDIGDDHRLTKIARTHSPLLASQLFFQYEFFRDMRKYVEAQEDLATAQGLPLSEWNRQSAIQRWLQKHGITEEEYSLESAYRQYLRKKSNDDRFFSEKICQKFKFSATGSEQFRLCTYGSNGYLEPVIRFWAFSRSKEKMIRCKHIISRQYVKAGTHMDYYYEASEIINSFLTKGYSVA